MFAAMLPSYLFMKVSVLCSEIIMWVFKIIIFPFI